MGSSRTSFKRGRGSTLIRSFGNPDFKLMINRTLQSAFRPYAPLIQLCSKKKLMCILSIMSHEQLKPSKIQLPDAPRAIEHLPVMAWEEDVEIDTYLPVQPEPFPMFFEKRVYQGSSGKMYPLHF